MKLYMGRLRRAAALVAVSMAAVLPAAAHAASVNIYSYREEVLIRPILEAFTKETGIKTNLVSGKAEALLERLKAEGANSPADVLLTADVARLVMAKEAGVLQPVQSEILEKAIPATYRDDENMWFGVSKRARVIFYAPDRVKESELSTYEDLADPKWKGRICVRSSSAVYNQSLVADLISRNGAKAAEEWARKLVGNLARRPQGGDRDQIKAVAAGECDIGIANTYYYFGMISEPEGSADRQAAEKVAIFWPNQGGKGGVHVNVSGGGVTKSARNKAEAIKLLEFMVSEKAQQIYANIIYEYPMREGVEPAPVVRRHGSFEANTTPLPTYAKFGREAMMIFDRVGWR